MQPKAASTFLYLAGNFLFHIDKLRAILSWRLREKGDMAKKQKQATPHLRIRIEPELLARLEKSRTANNRTLTGEIIHRIEQTYRKSDDADLATLVFRAAFGERTGDLLRAFATAIWLVERRTGKKWHQDHETAFQVSVAIEEIIEWFSWRRRDPATDAAHLKYRDFSPPFHEFKVAALAKAAALETLQKMGIAPPDEEIDEAAAKYRADPQRLEAQERFAKWYAAQEEARLAERRKTVAKADPEAKDEGEGQ
jgi:hypothetical protein